MPLFLLAAGPEIAATGLSLGETLIAIGSICCAAQQIVDAVSDAAEKVRR